MRAELQQIHSGPGAVYRVVRGDEELCRAEVKPHPFRLDAYVTREDQLLYHIVGGDLLYVKEHPYLKRSGERSNYICEIRNGQGEPVGTIAQILPPKIFGPRWIRLELSGGCRTMYEVGRGRDGIKLPIYREDRQTALAEKEPAVKNNLDSYELAMHDEGELLAAVLLSVYYDWKNHCGEGKYNSRKTSLTWKTTFSRAVNSMYDPTFKDSCTP